MADGVLNDLGIPLGLWIFMVGLSKEPGQWHPKGESEVLVLTSPGRGGIKALIATGVALDSLGLPSDVGSVEGLAYHRAWDTLYWTSSSTSSITRHTVDQTQPGAIDREAVITMSEDDHPHVLALDECQNLMFWTNWNEQHPSIMRATLTGKNPHVIVSTDILTPNGLTIDHRAEKLYFSEGSLGKIERCEYDGSQRHVIVKSGPGTFLSLAVYDNYIFWSDWGRRAILRSNKFTGGETKILRSDIPHQPMGIIAVANDTNSCELSPCALLNGGCHDLCLLTPDGRVNCSCRGDRVLLANNRCVSHTTGQESGNNFDLNSKGSILCAAQTCCCAKVYIIQLPRISYLQPSAAERWTGQHENI
ncbi:low-density lipoprotein receptor-related protein 1B-like [Phodopus roborovskii]|uniref:low-density lipoprotein receptor-related protein 1B-like n=1 Tax=Phodopus roborovskii TaxID=109678 RepID=UPI0021E3B872|nr:low-density lipoprotein receptor-related protein 1B-like [Phodopus roborovskii]